MIFNIDKHILLAVHIATSVCMESKKKNMISSATDEPSGKHSACIVFRVCTSGDRKYSLTTPMAYCTYISASKKCSAFGKRARI